MARFSSQMQTVAEIGLLAYSGTNLSNTGLTPNAMSFVPNTTCRCSFAFAANSSSTMTLKLFGATFTFFPQGAEKEESSPLDESFTATV